MKEEVDLSAPSDEAIQLKRIADALEKLVNHLTGKVTYTYDNKFFLTKETP